MMIMIVAISCKKEDEQNIVPEREQELSFAVVPVMAPGSKSINEWECKPYEPTYLQVCLNGQDHYIFVFRLYGILYSQSIRMLLPPDMDSATYNISQFLLWNEGDLIEQNLPGIDDTIVMGTPLAGTGYASYVAYPLDFEVTVPVHDHFMIPMEVLCVQGESRRTENGKMKPIPGRNDGRTGSRSFNGQYIGN